MKKHILVVSDPAFPMSTSGFAQAAAKIIDGLLEAGHKVSHYARGTVVDPENKPSKWGGVTVMTPPYNDINGYHHLGTVLESEHFDAIVYEADPGSIAGWRQSVAVRSIPTVCHMAIEGAPILAPHSRIIADVMATGGIVATYTHFAANAIAHAVAKLFGTEKSSVINHIYVLPLGVDHADFRPSADRVALRKRIGIDQKLVVMNVARNNGRKQWARFSKSGIASAYKNLRNLWATAV